MELMHKLEGYEGLENKLKTNKDVNKLMKKIKYYLYFSKFLLKFKVFLATILKNKH